MVGFKSIIILFTLLLFGACVPQTKQTECSSNEAFNASLRTCVPVVNGPSSFINISNFLPTGPLVKYHNDGTMVTFSVVVDNPYAQAYTIQWERIYNGITYSLSPTTPTSYSVAPALFTGQFGTHVISVKIKDSTNQVVDSHNFELVINAAPKPIIQTASVTPALYSLSYNPNQVPLNFSFTVSNNGASMSGAGYRVDWELYRSGSLIDAETDTFPTVSPAGTLTSNGLNYPQYYFDPNSIDGIELGSYTIRARVTNTAAEVVAEQQWSVAVQHPPLSKVTNRPIYTAGTGPASTAATVAYDGIPYTTYTAYNFRPTTNNTGQANYCVNVASGTGSYATDSSFVRVDWYLDGSTLLYSNWTTAVDNQVCLTDGGAAVLSGLVFTNTLIGHSIVARVVDEGTGLEYTQSDMNPSLGIYPITWPITLLPQNQAPTVGFGSDNVITNCTTSGTGRTGCQVASDSNFKVKINLLNDDFYYTPFVEANFDYSIRLYQNGVLIQSCSKAGYLNADPALTALPDTNGTDGYECELRINSFSAGDTVNTAGLPYTIQAEIFDNGSPITTTDAYSSTLTWSFAIGAVSETENPPSIANWAISGSGIEGATNGITFAADITDLERDDHLYEIQYEASSGNWVTLTSGTIYRTDDVNPHSWSISYTLPESFLLSVTSCPASSGLRNGTCSVAFRLKLTDVVYTASAGSTTSGSTNYTIVNTNITPTMSLALFDPVPSTWSATSPTALVGFPVSFSINPSSFGDLSAPSAEKTFRYQWYAKNGATYVGVSDWQAISGATSANLIWTPSLAQLALDHNIQLMLCIDDQPATAVPVPNNTDSVCTVNIAMPSQWSVTSYDNMVRAYDLSTLTAPTTLAVTSNTVSDPGAETAIWYETPSTFNSVTSSAAYVVSIGNDKKIYVKKVIARSNGQLDTSTSSLIVSFDALEAPAIINTVKDLSVTGDGDELYIAYLASRNTAPASLYPQVRRIDLTQSGSKTAPNIHAGKIGFDYDGLAISNGCTPNPADCTITSTATSVDVTFAPSVPALSGSITLVTPAGSKQIDIGVYNGIDEISNNSGTQMAQDLMNIINSSVLPELAGYTATITGSTVSITGAMADDFFDAHLSTVERSADQLGQIYISGGSWYLPFINNSLGGADNDKISYYTGATNGLIIAAAVTVNEPPTNSNMSAIGQLSKFSSYFDGTNLWLATISKVGSQGRIYKVDPISFNYASGTDDEPVLAGDILTDIQIAVSSTRAFVGTKLLAGDLKIQVFDNNVDPHPNLSDSAFEIDDSAHVQASTDTSDYFNPASISSWKILAYNQEARIIAAAKGPLPDVTYDLYVARLQQVSSVWTLSCGDCAQVSELSQTNSVSPYVKINAAPIRVADLTSAATAALYRMGSDGANDTLAFPGYDGVRDVAFISYGRFNGASAADPAMGVLNVQPESIYTDTLFTGPGPLDVGLSRPPIVK